MGDAVEANSLSLSKGNREKVNDAVTCSLITNYIDVSKDSHAAWHGASWLKCSGRRRGPEVRGYSSLGYSVSLRLA